MEIWANLRDLEAAARFLESERAAEVELQVQRREVWRPLLADDGEAEGLVAAMYADSVPLTRSSTS